MLSKFLMTSLIGFAAGAAFAQTASPNVIPSTNYEHRTNGRKAFHTNYIIYNGIWKHRSLDEIFQAMEMHGPAQSTIAGYHPADIQAAYHIPANYGTRAIAVIDAYHLPTNLNDFNTFSAQFGLPTEPSSTATLSTNRVFQVVYPGGSQPAKNADWGAEIAIDMEWAHALAPNAKVYLVECVSDAESDLFAGVQWVNQNLPDVSVVSMSFGGSEDPTETQYDPLFNSPNTIYLAASGDTSNTVSYPSESPNVIAVGGTTLNLSGGAVSSETYWYQDANDAGSAGLSTVEPRPSYQNGYASLLGNFRGNNDMAAEADPSTGCAVYDSTPIPSDGNASGWLVFGGTSLACPICAGILNDRGYNQPTSFAELTQLYSLAGTGYFRDITKGSNGTQSAGAGFDLVTGLGAPLGVFVNHTFSFNSGNAIAGTVTAGTPQNMIAKDGHSYTVRSVKSGTSEIASIGATFSGSGFTSPIGGKITVTGTSGASSVTVYALNPTTGNYDSIGQINLVNTNQTATLTSSALGSYINSSGVIKFQLVASNSGSTLATLSIDQITFTAGTLS